MLQRAATNAYSWWWASHIRTKQSKWLEQNLADMEERAQGMLKIIEQEGDSFAKRAEMYYKKRPELIQFVEETYKAYRALAERYDHMSKDLQNANRTLATVFPEQIQLSVESDDDTSSHGSINLSSDGSEKSLKAPKSLPKAPKFPKLPPSSLKGETLVTSRKEQLRTASGSSYVAIGNASGLTKEEAVKEIDVLQKEILTLQTEKEFLKSSYEAGLAKFWEVEGKITELQTRLYNLQDEFGFGTVIEDHEARSLMAATALSSCSEALSKLQKEQERSMEAVKAEYARIKEAHGRLEALKQQGQKAMEQEEKQESLSEKSLGVVAENVDLNEGLKTDVLREKIREKLRVDCGSALTEPEISDKIDELVEKIVVLETTVFSQNGLLKRLREYIDELLQHIRNLEENSETIFQNEEKTKKISELEEELSRVKCLNQDLVQQKSDLQAELTEANCNVDHLKEKLEDVKPIEEVKEAKDEHDVEAEKEKEVQDKGIDVICHDIHTLHHPHKKEDEEEKQLLKAQTEDSTTLDAEVPDLKLEDKDGLNWRRLHMNNIEERERVLVDEYTVILRDYKDIKVKLSEAEKKNRERVLELASHARELRNTIVAKDEEIQLLRGKLDALQGNQEESADPKLEGLKTQEEDKQQQQQQIQQEDQRQHKRRVSSGELGSSLASEIEPDRMPLFHHLYDPKTGIITRSASVSGSSHRRADTLVESTNQPLSRVPARLRAELDDLLEGNLDFWLRFSTTFHQIQKFQTTTKDLQGEISKLREAKNAEGSNKNNLQTLQSEARPHYKHLREIQTEMTLWLEHSTVFQEELKSRFTSLDNIQEEIVRVVNAGKKSGNPELSDYQAAKFQGEVQNMKQENSKVAEELQAGINRVKGLKVETEKALTKLDREFKLSQNKLSYSGILKSPLSKPRIPLQTFLFGMKLKKKYKFSTFL